MTPEIVFVLMWLSSPTCTTLSNEDQVCVQYHNKFVTKSAETAAVFHKKYINGEEKKSFTIEVRGVTVYNQGIEEIICKVMGHLGKEIPCGPYFVEAVIRIWPEEKCRNDGWLCAHCRLKKRIVRKETQEEVFER